MSKEEKFEFDLRNVKKDLEIEGMTLTEEDIELIKKYLNKEISMEELIGIVLAR